MKKILIVVDMQNDFITGSLGSLLTQNVVPNVTERVRKAMIDNEAIIFTQDTHNADYLSTPEGAKLPVEHCIAGTKGWKIIPELIDVQGEFEYTDYAIIKKPIFGSVKLMEFLNENWDFNGLDIPEIEFIGVCTDICVVSNALMAKSYFPNAKISVDASCCAGTTINNHLSAIDVMRSCQIDIIEPEEKILEKELVR